MAEVVEGTPLTAAETPPHPDRRAVPSVLVVDDQANAREMLTQFLSLRGFLVHTATDGLDAIAVAQRVLPSIILMDLMMPCMDGFEATRRLKADTRTSAIPVIAYTAGPPANGRQLARAAGCDDLLLKPCDLDQLADDLRKRVTLARYPRRRKTDQSVKDAIEEDIVRDHSVAANIALRADGLRRRRRQNN